MIWLTGLSGAGKSTIADAFESRLLFDQGALHLSLTATTFAWGLNRDLGFTDADRVENIRRTAEVAKLMADAGLVVIVALISPFRSERSMARRTAAGSWVLRKCSLMCRWKLLKAETQGFVQKSSARRTAELYRYRFSLRGAGKCRSSNRYQ